MQIKLLLVCAAAAVALCSCEEAPSSSVASEEKPRPQTTAVQTQPVEIKEYGFPEFVEDKATSDMLSNVISSGFDPAAAESFLDVSPFEDYNCDRCLGGEYYTFFEEDYIGVLDSNGALLVKPDKYTGADMVSKDLIRLSYPEKSGKKPDLLLVNKYTSRIVSDMEAQKTEIVTILTGDRNNNQYALSVRGQSATDAYDSIEKLSSSQVVTNKPFSEIYKAVIGNQCYFLVLDEYRNITVCEAPYALISFKLAGQYGQCYILNNDDHSELLKMIHSFGSETISVKPSKDESLDYIRIESGLNIGEKRTITMSPDGFCLTETGSEAEGINRFFALYPKETFVDLVSWVNEVVSKEYVH